MDDVSVEQKAEIQIEKFVEELNVILEKIQIQRRSPAYLAPQNDQDAVLRYFIGRAIQIAQACILTSHLATPLEILCRVLCEDFFLVAWIAKSEGNAQEYKDGAISEVAKMMRLHLISGRAVLRQKSSGKVATEEFMATEFMPKLQALDSPRMKLEQIAQQCGFQRVYDILYRSSTLEVHANSFDLFQIEGDISGSIPTLSSVVTLLDCILLIVAYPRREVTSQEILRIMRLEKLAGK